MSKIKTILSTACILLCFSLQVHAATYEYDNIGRLTKVTYDSGKKITYTYDAGGNILSVASTGGVVNTVSGISLDAQTLSLGTGSTHAIEVTAAYADGTSAKVTTGVTYSSSNAAAATVSATGVITAVSPGQATITATYGGKTATMVITVTPAGDTEAPTAPTDLAATDATQTTISLAWTASTDNTGIKGYQILRDGVKITSTTKTSYINSNLVPGKAYTYTIKAYDAAGNLSEDSNAVTETTLPDPEAPSTPADLASTAVTYTSITLAWTASTDNVAVKGYEIYRDGKKIAATTKTTYANTGLVPGTKYTYYIKAYDTAGNYSAQSNTIEATTVADTEAPTAPQELKVDSFTATTVTLSWNAATDNVAVRGYEIYRDGTKIATTSKTTYTNTGLIPGKTYTYIVKAYDTVKNTCEGTNSVTVTTVADPVSPSVPEGLTATTTEVTASLSWAASTDNVGVKGYEIYRDGVKIATTSKTSYTNINLIPGKTYNYAVKAYDIAGNVSELSTPVAAATVADLQAPTVPSSLTASEIKETSVTLTWTASTDNIKMKGYEIYRDGAKIRTTSLTNFTNTGLIPGKTYTYMVKAYDIAGNISEASDTISVTTIPDTQAPTVPTDLSGIATEVSVALTWTVSTDNTVLKGYYIYRDGVKIATTSKTSYTNTGLIPGKTYAYLVKAYDIVNNISEASNTISVTTIPDNQVPTTPTDLTGTATEVSAALTWVASTDNTVLKGYYVYRDGVKIATTSKTSYTNTGLIPGKTYAYLVKAYDIVNNISEESNTISVTTIPDNQVPTTPTDLTGTADEVSVALTWTASTDNTVLKGYYIYRDGVKIATTSKNSYTNTGLMPGKTYSYVVKAYDIVGNVSGDSNALSITTIADTQAPIAPAGLTSSIASSTSVALSWTAATDNVKVKGYYVYRDGVKIATTANTTYTASKLTTGKTYTFTVKAYDLVNNISPDSNAETVTVQ